MSREKPERRKCGAPVVCSFGKTSSMSSVKAVNFGLADMGTILLNDIPRLFRKHKRIQDFIRNIRQISNIECTIEIMDKAFILMIKYPLNSLIREEINEFRKVRSVSTILDKTQVKEEGGYL